MVAVSRYGRKIYKAKQFEFPANHRVWDPTLLDSDAEEEQIRAMEEPLEDEPDDVEAGRDVEYTEGEDVERESSEDDLPEALEETVEVVATQDASGRVFHSISYGAARDESGDPDGIPVLATSDEERAYVDTDEEEVTTEDEYESDPDPEPLEEALVQQIIEQGRQRKKQKVHSVSRFE